MIIQFINFGATTCQGESEFVNHLAANSDRGNDYCVRLVCRGDCGGARGMKCAFC